MAGVSPTGRPQRRLSEPLGSARAWRRQAGIAVPSPARRELLVVGVAETS